MGSELGQGPQANTLTFSILFLPTVHCHRPGLALAGPTVPLVISQRPWEFDTHVSRKLGLERSQHCPERRRPQRQIQSNQNSTIPLQILASPSRWGSRSHRLSSFSLHAGRFGFRPPRSLLEGSPTVRASAWVWWCLSSQHSRQRQEGPELQASLGCTVKPCFKHETKQNKMRPISSPHVSLGVSCLYS